MLIVVFYAESVQSRNELRSTVTISQTTCNPFINFAAKFFLNNSLVNIHHLLNLGSFFHRTSYHTTGNANFSTCNYNLICQSFNFFVNASLFCSGEATNIYFTESVAGNYANLIVGRTNHTNIHGVLRNELTCIHNATCFQSFCCEIFRITGHGASKFVNFSNSVRQLVNCICAMLGSVTVVTANTGNFYTIFCVALTLGNNTPVGAGNVHNNCEVGLLRQFRYNFFRSFGTAFFFTVGIVNNFLKVFKASFLQSFQTIDNFHNGSFIVTNTRTPSKTVFINTERTFRSFTLIENSINVGNEKNSQLSFAFQTGNQMASTVIVSIFSSSTHGFHMLCNKFVGSFSTFTVAVTRIDVSQDFQILNVVIIVIL